MPNHSLLQDGQNESYSFHMAPSNRASQARRHLDRRFKEFGPAIRFSAPPSGWLRAVREALGMSARALGHRLGVTGQAVSAMESSEVEGRIQLETLQRAADAMGCELVYAIVPKTSLEEFVLKRAQRVAAEQMRATSATMAIEDQRADVDEDLLLRHAHELAQSGRIWRDALQ